MKAKQWGRQAGMCWRPEPEWQVSRSLCSADPRLPPTFACHFASGQERKLDGNTGLNADRALFLHVSKTGLPLLAMLQSDLSSYPREAPTLPVLPLRGCQAGESLRRPGEQGLLLRCGCLRGLQQAMPSAPRHAQMTRGGSGTSGTRGQCCQAGGKASRILLGTGRASQALGPNLSWEALG